MLSPSLNKDLLHTYQTVGTLCDEPNGLTCSFDAARRWGKAERIEAYASFEEAAYDVKRNIITAFLVPCAYPHLSSFIMDAELVAQELFLMKIPPLVLVGRSKNAPTSATILFHHAATTPLLPEIRVKFLNSEFASSNSKACVLLLENHYESIAITNTLCASFYHLNIYKIMREGIKMPFICFIKAESAKLIEVRD